jgi:hypothetical protein
MRYLDNTIERDENELNYITMFRFLKGVFTATPYEWGEP